MSDLRSLPNIIGSIASVRDYFANFAKEDPLLLPELDVAERIMPLLTPETLIDDAPRMEPVS